MSKMIIYGIAVASLVCFVLQVVALAHDGAYVHGKNSDSSSDCSGCGIFNCNCGGSLRNTGCAKINKRMKAACAFGVLACLTIAVCMICHIMLCFGKTAGMLLGNSLGSQLVDYMWAVHVASVVFLIICWALLAAVYDQELCNSKIKNWADLTFGFVFLIINTVIEAVLAYCCWRHMHVGSSGGRGGGGGHRGPPPGYYESNPIDRQGFQRRY